MNKELIEAVFGNQPETTITTNTTMETPSEDKIKQIIDKKLKESELLQNPRERKTRIIVEILMKEMYLTGFNQCLIKNQK